MHKIMDYIVNLLKLPAALYLLFSVPALVMGDHQLAAGALRRLVHGDGVLRRSDDADSQNIIQKKLIWGNNKKVLWF